MGSRCIAVLRATIVLLVCLGVFAVPARADVIYDPITRVRDAGGSILITSLPFTFSFTFSLTSGLPTNPYPASNSCQTGTDASTQLLPGDPAQPWVSCTFENLTGMTISLLDFLYTSQTFPSSAQVLNNLFASAVASSTTAQFAGGSGIGPNGAFRVDWIGFDDGSIIQMTAANPIPEPGTLLLLGCGTALAGLVRRRRR